MASRNIPPSGDSAWKPTPRFPFPRRHPHADTALEARTNLPEIRKQVAPDRVAEVLRAARTTRAGAGANGSFDHFDVAITPFLDTFIQIDEAFAQLGVLCVLAIHGDQLLLCLR